MDARIANTLLDYARQCDRTARNGKLYESRLKAKGRAAAYRTAAKLIAAKMLAVTYEKRARNALPRGVAEVF